MRALLALPVAFMAAVGQEASAQVVVDLHEALDRGQAQIASIRGNGYSTGAALEGEVVNVTESNLHVEVQLRRPLFFINAGRGQNMIAISVYLSDGPFLSDGRREFIRLRPGQRTAVSFLALCVDFDKDNPSGAERFSLGSMPARLAPVLNSLREYMQENPQTDVTVAAQLALWRAQGITQAEIDERFPSELVDRLRAGVLLSGG